MLTANEIRKKFLDFFKSKGHTIVNSVSLVPPESEDKTVLFTTAGMQQFKRQFLGHIEGYTRAASSQKCLRTDDLEKVGKTPVHHTFFEMLGNFSFGDYFKKDAIAWAWEFFTKVLGISADKLWVSVYQEDDEAYNVWLKDIRIPKERILKLGDKDNFWPAEAREKGPNGPCGPCSEIFFDFGINPDCSNKNLPVRQAGDCDPTCNCGRFAEVWNLVFTQFNRKDGGVLEPLPAKNIDTGMGLERLVAVMQGKKNNYETDLFQPIIKAIEEETKHFGYSITDIDKRIIADHIRAITFGIADGVIPSNDGRGYIMKRLIIDATDKMIPMGRQGARLYKLISTVAKVMQDPYTELSNKADDIAGIIRKIQESYLITRNERIPELKEKTKRLKDISNNIERTRKLGELIFLYRDTYGLTTATIEKAIGESAIENNIVVESWKFYDDLMEDQKNKSRAGSKMTGDVFADAALNLNVPKTEFTGYDQTRGTAAILKLFIENKEVAEAKAGQAVKIVLDKTPFYAESGGQMGDTGTITKNGFSIHVTDTQKIVDVFIHSGVIHKGTFKVNDEVDTQIDKARRLSIMRNHTATHLLQAALRKVLGTHVQQQGSLVAPDRLRFDFTHPQALTKEQTQTIESLVNGQIKANNIVEKKAMDLKEAKESGAMAFFAEKYKDIVRVVSIGDYSKELCGGTHLKSTGEIKKFRITNESAIAQGIRRIEARTAEAANDFDQEKKKQEAERAESQAKRLKELEEQKKSDRQSLESFKNSLNGVINDSPIYGNTKIITHTFENVSQETLRYSADLIKQNTQSVAIIVGSTFPDSAIMVVATSGDLVQKGISAPQTIKELPSAGIPFYGGGQPTFAQAGSKDPKQLPKAIEKVKNLIREKLL